jgi:hypothetical protein
MEHSAKRIHPSSRLVRDYGGQVAHGVKTFKGKKKIKMKGLEVKSSRQKEQGEGCLYRKSMAIDSMSAFFDYKSAFLRECL